MTEWTTTSAPCSNGRCTSGVANVLSTPTSAPAGVRGLDERRAGRRPRASGWSATRPRASTSPGSAATHRVGVVDVDERDVDPVPLREVAGVADRHLVGVPGQHEPAARRGPARTRRRSTPCPSRTRAPGGPSPRARRAPARTGATRRCRSARTAARRAAGRPARRTSTRARAGGLTGAPWRPRRAGRRSRRRSRGRGRPGCCEVTAAGYRAAAAAGRRADGYGSARRWTRAAVGLGADETPRRRSRPVDRG